MINLSAYTGDRIAILGLGKSGLSAAQALLAADADISAWDDNQARRAEASFLSVPLQNLHETDFSSLDLLILSPGIPHSFPEPHPVVLKARAAGVPVVCDIDLLDTDADKICITGTNGKSTTTALVGHILKEFRPAQTGGNIGHPALSLEDMGPDGTYVLELSSYQIELAPHLQPAGAALLNITPDHLDRHGGMEGYIAAKKMIFAHPAREGAVAVIGIDTPPSRLIADQVESEKKWTVLRVSTEREIPDGVHVKEGQLYDRGRLIADLGDAPNLKGRHNHENAACAYALIRYVYRYEPAAIIRAMLSFPGLPHRQYPVRTIGRVAYINDSKATNADAAARALACYDDIYWILGGLSKDGGLNGLESYADRIHHAFVIGQAAPAFGVWLEQAGIAFTQCETLDHAVVEAHRQAQTHGSGTVLLSPACASWDQFLSFEHRGDTFAALVNSLPETVAA